MCLGQAVDGVENDVALGAGHAGRGLVEEQDLRLQAQRDRELDQALAAVGQLPDAVPRVLRELQGLQQVHRLVDHVPPQAGGPKHGRGGADALGDREVDVVQHREPAEQPIDLEGARDAELDPFGLGDARDVTSLEQHRARRGRDQAGQEIDERGLAGAVGTDQRVARAGLQAKVDVARGGERAEDATEAAGLEQGRAHRSAATAGRRRHRLSTTPRMPFLANSAMTTSRSPNPSCQAVG